MHLQHDAAHAIAYAIGRDRLDAIRLPDSFCHRLIPLVFRPVETGFPSRPSWGQETHSRFATDSQWSRLPPRKYAIPKGISEGHAPPLRMGAEERDRGCLRPVVGVMPCARISPPGGLWRGCRGCYASAGKARQRGDLEGAAGALEAGALAPWRGRPGGLGAPWRPRGAGDLEAGERSPRPAAFVPCLFSCQRRRARAPGEVA